MKTGALFYAVLIFALLVSNLSFGNSVNDPPKKRTSNLLIKSNKTTHFVDNVPPIISATDNQIYCPLTSVNIATTINIIDPDNTSTDAIYIQISSGYINGQDKLFLNPTLSHPTIEDIWDPVEGKLTLKNPTGAQVTYIDFENAIKNVQFYNSSPTPTGNRSFSITTGHANYLPRNGHYYLYFPDIGISWTDAKDKAASSSYYGLKGYLATVTALDEAQFVGQQLPGAGWIGGSDAETEDVWKWATGPEAGTIFWTGNFFNGSTPNFAYWNTGEPNNQDGNENYTHITPSGVGTPGTWNDLKIDGESSGNYQPKGYIVEYGGMLGDIPISNLSASTTLTIAPTASITSTTPASRCDAGTLTLQATASTGTINWYSSAAGGNNLGTGPDFKTPIINATTTYYVETTTANCSSERTAVPATINITPTITNTNSPVTNCGPGSFTLTAAPLVGTVNWYSQINGTIVDTGFSYTTPSISTNTTYYAEAINNGCTNGTKVPVDLHVYPLPEVSDQIIEKCTLGTITLDASIPNMKYLWSTGETSQTIIATTPGNYYVDVTSPAPENCNSRKKITVLINSALDISISSTTPASRCDAGTVTLQAAASTGTINWYNIAVGGNSLGTGPNFTTPTITATTTYFVETTTANCSSGRTPVQATINITPAITSANSPVTHCGPGPFTLTTATQLVGTVNWYSPNGGTVVGSGSSYTTPTISTNTTYYAEAINNGCTNGTRVPVELLVYPLPAVTNQTVEKCILSTITLNASIPNMKYLWNTGETTQAIVASTAGPYTVDITSPSPQNCTNRETITVFENNNLITSTTPATRCDTGTVTLQAVATAGTINWYDAVTFGNKIGTGSNFITPILNTTTTYYVETATANCSSKRAAVDATINFTPTITSIKSPVTNCGPGIFTLTATPSGGTINWYSQIDGTILESGSSYTTPIINTNTTYFAEAANNGCTSNKTPIDLLVYPLPEVADETVGKCSSNTVALDASVPNMTYTWSTGETTQTITVSTAGAYTVDVTSLAPESCTNRKTITVIENNTPEIKNIIVDETTISIELVKTEDYFEYSIDGNNFQSSNIFTNVPFGLHTAYVRDLYKCSTNTQPFIVVSIPKFFTPNNDTQNDFWKVNGLVDYPLGEVIIFDRYGKLITVLNRYNPSWDGTLNKRPLPSSDYWYVIKLDPNSPEFRGHFALKR